MQFPDGWRIHKYFISTSKVFSAVISYAHSHSHTHWLKISAVTQTKLNANWIHTLNSNKGTWTRKIRPRVYFLRLIFHLILSLLSVGIRIDCSFVLTRSFREICICYCEYRFQNQRVNQIENEAICECYVFKAGRAVE